MVWWAILAEKIRFFQLADECRKNVGSGKYSNIEVGIFSFWIEIIQYDVPLFFISLSSNQL
jgi:hypothetical protein